MPTPRIGAWMLFLVLSGLLAGCIHAETTALAVGTLASCSGSSCQWAGVNGVLVDGDELQRQLLDLYMPRDGDFERVRARRRLATHMERLEAIQKHADAVGHAFSYRIGVNQRHLMTEWMHRESPKAFVQREQRAAVSWRPLRRRMQDLEQVGRRLAGSSSSSSWSANHTDLDWCATNNPSGRNVCSAVKSQNNCGSCWAFAATDAIESAVAIEANLSTPMVLSVQQFLSCSQRNTEDTFTYCWARDSTNYSTSAPWLSDTIRWTSSNDGCNGGMTHGAFMDAAQLHFGLLPEILMPYVQDDSSSSTPTCVRSSNQSVASISSWAQVAGPDCSVSSDPGVLLRRALETQPIAVAINAGGVFRDYSGGFYSCPDNGNILVKDDVNHALVLVGYGTDASKGDYWILKNSYGSAWGDRGYMKLLADKKLNCGLNIFPVVPLGAVASGSYSSNITVDGGGDDRMLGVAVSGWIAIAIAVSIATVVLTVVGVLVNRKRRAKLRSQASGLTALNEQMMLYE